MPSNTPETQAPLPVTVAAIVADMKEIREVWIGEGGCLSDAISYVEEWASRLAALSSPTPDHIGKDAVRETVLFNLTWIAPPSPELPDGRRVHPEPMTGRQSFPSWEKTLRFMSKRCEGTEFVSLTQTTSRTVDRSAEFRAALQHKGEVS